MTRITVKELQLGDKVRLAGQDFPYNHMTVKHLADETEATCRVATLVRPYIHVSDFATSSGVIVYTGMEELTFYGYDSSTQFDLLERREETIR